MSRIDKENLKLIFQETKDKLLNQMNTGDKLDSKASTIMGFIGILVGVIFGFTFYLKSFTTDVLSLVKTSVFLLISSFLFAFIAFMNIVYRYDPHPETLVKKYLFKKYDETMEQLVYNYVISYEDNKKKLIRKAILINISMMLLFISLITLFVGIFWR